MFLVDLIGLENFGMFLATKSCSGRQEKQNCKGSIQPNDWKYIF